MKAIRTRQEPFRYRSKALLTVAVLAFFGSVGIKAFGPQGATIDPIQLPAPSTLESVPNTQAKNPSLSLASLQQTSLQNLSTRVLPLPKQRNSIPASQSANTSYFYRNNRNFASCADLSGEFAHSGLSQFRGIASIAEIDVFVKSRMLYRMDGANTDRWENLAGMVLTNKNVKGDCDDMAITAAAIAICAGADPTRVGFAIFNAKTNRAAGANHIVATYTEPSGRVVAFGDSNSPFIWNTADKHLQPKFTARASNINQWFKH